MAVLPIRVFPDPILKEKAAPVEGATPEVSAFVDDLVDTMRNAPGGVGIAAPQVGVPWRIIAVDVSAHRRGSREPNHGLLVLLNPEILAMGGQQVVREGCMSVPEYTANVRRAEWVLVDALDREESAGAHFREEFQTEAGEALRDDRNWCFTSAWEHGDPPIRHAEPLRFTAVALQERDYR